MTTETMTIRAALKEKKILDERIEKLSHSMHFAYACSALNPNIGLMSPAEKEEEIKANWQSLSDMIKRREAINRAIMENNAITKISVPKFVSFDSVSKGNEEREEVSLATAINRKNYYTEILRNQILRILYITISSDVKSVNKTITDIQDKVNKTVHERFAGQTNYSQASMQTVTEQETERQKPIVINPLKAETLLDPITDKIEDYIQTIDNLLSNATEVTQITVTY